MITFELEHSYVVYDDLQCNVCLKPSSDEIKKYIAIYKTYETEQEALLDLNNFMSEQRPLLFNSFQLMDNVPQYIRDNYIL